MAVNETFCPYFDGFADDVMPVLLGCAGGGFTRCTTVGGIGHGPVVLGSSTAMMVWSPTERLLVVNSTSALSFRRSISRSSEPR